MKNLRLFLIAIAATASVLSGCAVPNRGGAGYTAGEARRAMQVSYGTIESLRVVQLERNPREGNVGGTAGAVIGGVAGSSVGGGRGSIVGAVAGAVAGGVLGSHAEANLARRDAWEITIKGDDGRTFAVVQEIGQEQFGIGQRVRVLTDGRGQVRITP